MSRFKRSLITYLAFFAVIFLMTFMFSGEYYFVYLMKGKSVDFWKQFIWNLSRGIPYIVLFPVVIWLANRFQINRFNLWRIGPIHLLFSLCFSLVHSSFYFLYDAINFFSESNIVWTFQNIIFNIVNSMMFNILTYWMILAIGLIFAYNRKNREYELKHSRIQAQLAQSQLQVLRMQLHPHFFFNTLHTISALINKSPKSADKMISRLSELLRLSLDSSSQQEVALKQELDYLNIYLDIEKTRFNDRLRTDILIDEEVHNAMVPNLILQPLVENAIRHGIGPNKGTGILKIHAGRENNKLKIVIEDNGKGFKESDLSGVKKGIGLSNTAERLKQLYGKDADLVLENTPDGGACVTILLPWRITCRKSKKPN